MIVILLDRCNVYIRMGRHHKLQQCHRIDVFVGRFEARAAAPDDQPAFFVSALAEAFLN